MTLSERQITQGAVLAADGIPQHYGDLKIEYRAALETVVIMDRSHEGRLMLSGKDRITIIQRASTNDLLNMPLNTGRPTIFTNPNGRILDRITVYNRGETALILTEPGRGAAVKSYLQRQIFFNDDVQVSDLAESTRLFALHGPSADNLVAVFAPDAANREAAELNIGGAEVFFARRKSVSGGSWSVIVPASQAEAVWVSLCDLGAAHGLQPAGSLTYNTLRIRAGLPGVGRELSPDYIPLEAGLWDEVSFTKGCYTGQEIIARMESRNRLAKTLVMFELSAWVEAPAPILHDGKTIGMLTSSVTTPDGEILGMGFVKVLLAVPQQRLVIGENNIEARITALTGAQPPQLASETI